MRGNSRWGPDPRMIPPSSPVPPPEAPVADAVGGDEVFLRPFMVTGGRTTPRHAGLRVETLLHATPDALVAPLRFEARRIVELCREPKAVADVAVALRQPLGVVRVLADDLVDEGHLRIEDQLGELPLALIERIVDRVSAL
ncbi:DUF742 domain-containing protein [Actinoplanes bogorensis]|uniref:DUF742 domain-containing protein n=1 Tax=Paractinoplanes bogorensis TaxID=1610840 RepID=A0ABS5YR63_9ACTN|nr:DUF742 domain-containing protein [Actinoplanes bogorensis]MBU2665209.1 DUF742 domain-containing protein [Actinoplanes bogorensis]